MTQNWWFWIIAASSLIPILGIISGAACVITAKVIRHRERMAMIENGMDPDAHSNQLS